MEENHVKLNGPATELAHKISGLNQAQLTRRSLLTGALLGVGYWTTGRTSTSPTELSAASPPQFLLPRNLVRTQKPLFESRMIEHPSPMGFAHCASICQSLRGLTHCAWYAGSREGARDVQVWTSTLDRGVASEAAWSPPRPIINRETASKHTQQFVRKVGNSVIFCDSRDRLWMIYVSIAMGGWATSSLNATFSDDGGTNWSTSQRLWLSPLLNISDLVRCPPVFMSDGQIGLPIYQECAGIYPELLWLKTNGNELEYSKNRICGGREWLQPSIVPTGGNTALCYLRCMSNIRAVGLSATNDGGQSWSEPSPLPLPNPNSAVCGVLLNDSAILLALNYSTDKRDSISLAYSPNGIDNWSVIATLDQQDNQKFSYPSMIRAHDGLVHLVYSWQMQKVRHVCFNEAWVLKQLRESSLAVRDFVSPTQHATMLPASHIV